MIWFQKTIDVIAPKRGFILITEHIYNRLVELENIKIGTLHLYIKHTSASLTVNENADSTVRDDLETFFNKSVPESKDNYTHTYEFSPLVVEDIYWNGNDLNNYPLPQGIYIYKLHVNNLVNGKKVTLHNKIFKKL